jgi:hypothetical protein
MPPDPSSPATSSPTRPVSPPARGVSLLTPTGGRSSPGGAGERQGGAAAGKSVAPLRVGSCFSGAGMLDVAAHGALGGVPGEYGPECRLGHAPGGA